jgi:hypothetical protein
MSAAYSPASVWTQQFTVPAGIAYLTGGVFLGSGADSFNVQIQRGGTAIAQVNVVAGNDWGADNESFGQVPVTPGESLTIVIQPNGGSTNKNFEQAYVTGSPYSGVSVSEGCSWVAGTQYANSPGGSLYATVSGLGI